METGFVLCEPYAHKCAKEVLCGWLRAAAEFAGYDKYAGISPVSWRVNRDGPEWGVHMEYPFTQENYDNGYCVVWDEQGTDSSPSFEQLSRLSYKVAAIADVAIQHKGSISAVFEVVWTNPLSAEKVDFYKRVGIFDVFEIDATLILAQTAPPSQLNCITHIFNGERIWHIPREVA